MMGRKLVTREVHFASSDLLTPRSMMMLQCTAIVVFSICVLVMPFILYYLKVRQ